MTAIEPRAITGRRLRRALRRRPDDQILIEGEGGAAMFLIDVVPGLEPDTIVLIAEPTPPAGESHTGPEPWNARVLRESIALYRRDRAWALVSTAADASPVPVIDVMEVPFARRSTLLVTGLGTASRSEP